MSRSKSKRAGLHFPVGRIQRKLRQSKQAKRVSEGAGIYLAAVLEYLTAEVLELAAVETFSERKKRIMPKHIMMAVRRDDELDEFLQRVTFAGTGVVPRAETQEQIDIQIEEETDTETLLVPSDSDEETEAQTPAAPSVTDEEQI